MFRPIQNPQRPLSHALIVNSRTSFGHPAHNSPIERKNKKANTEGITLPGSIASRHARNGPEPSSSKLHRAKCRDGEQVTGDVRSFNAPKRGGGKGGLEQIPHLL
jgi:hypothetical protein